ncbi:MAG: [protein-PII] uridylyltransferase [Hyphomicrobiaceae bacterium]|nr:[protein-PII] uridylyltransferase [Hyphomicrobiaceae bacterium]
MDTLPAPIAIAESPPLHHGFEPHVAPPYFDPVELRAELTALFRANGEDPAAAKLPVLTRLKALVKAARAEARLQLDTDLDGRRCATGLSIFQDELVKLIYDYMVAHVWRATNPSDAERMAVVATGGYGRGLLAPGSDIDLLFLLPYKKTPWAESIAEAVLYMLWDLGFKVGHATRTVDQCLKLSLTDMTIRTSLLDARLIHGDRDLYADFERRFRDEITASRSREFVEAKMTERAERHRKSGQSRYRVEPNVKDGKGGLRDLHTLHWLVRHVHGDDVGPRAVEAGLFSVDEVETFKRCEDFLWTVRCFLHFVTGRAEERLSFDVQPQLAEALGYRDRAGVRGVEVFMKQYFLVAKDVGSLTNTLSTGLEMRQLNSAPGLSSLMRPITWAIRRDIRKRTDFRLDNDRLNVASADVFERDPVNILRYFAHAERTDAALHPDAIRLLSRSLYLIDNALRDDPTANRVFLDILTGRTNPEMALRRMNEAGVLERFVPQFRNVVAMMQFNMYHHFTVDEHLIRTVGQLTDIELGRVKAELPVSSGLMAQVANRTVLYVAAFLHDIGKGLEEDHSIVGARVARELCPRLGMSAAETETVAWLIAEHLTMSNIAQSRDISDPKTIRDFADIVQSPERLKLLLILTVADIRAVGPGVWNGWKGQLLRSLYYEAEPIVAGGHTISSRDHRVALATDALRAALPGFTEAEQTAFIDRHYTDYWLRTDTQQQVEHAELLRRAGEALDRIVTAARTDAFRSITELTIYAPNHARLLSLFAGACAAAGASITGARITTTRDGFALDTFLLAREFETDEDELRRTNRIHQTIDDVLSGKVRLADLLRQRRGPTGRYETFRLEPEVQINNTVSDRFTVIEVAGLDRTGLLYDLTSALSDLNLDIASAHITTFGEKAVDVFYVTDLMGKKLASTDREAAILSRLKQVLTLPSTQSAVVR